MGTIIEMPNNDRVLVEKILRGDINAFSEIVRHSEKFVTQIVFRLIDNKEDRKDLIQDVYLKTFENLSKFRFRARLSTWIGRIAYNTCWNYMDKQKQMVSIDADHRNSEETLGSVGEKKLSVEDDRIEARLIDIERNLIIQKAIDRLGPVYRLLITLYHHEDQSYKEISQITDLPIGTVKGYLFRARAELKNKLQNYFNHSEI